MTFGGTAGWPWFVRFPHPTRDYVNLNVTTVIAVSPASESDKALWADQVDSSYAASAPLAQVICYGHTGFEYVCGEADEVADQIADALSGLMVPRVESR